MIRFSLFAFIALIAPLSLAARSAADFFISAPDAIFRLLPQSTRMDMVDYFNYGSSRASDNYFGGEAKINELSESYISFDIDRDVTVCINLLPTTKGDTVIAMVTTLSLPVEDSELSFFSSDWQPISPPPVKIPSYDEWITPLGKSEAANIGLFLSFIPVKAEFSRDGRTLTFSNGALSFLGNSADVSPEMLVPEIIYDVEGARFTRRK